MLKVINLKIATCNAFGGGCLYPSHVHVGKGIILFTRLVSLVQMCCWSI